MLCRKAEGKVVTARGKEQRRKLELRDGRDGLDGGQFTCLSGWGRVGVCRYVWIVMRRKIGSGRSGRAGNEVVVVVVVVAAVRGGMWRGEEGRVGREAGEGRGS